MSLVNAIAQSTPVAPVAPGRTVSDRRASDAPPISRDRVTVSEEARRLADDGTDARGSADTEATSAASTSTGGAAVDAVADGTRAGGDAAGAGADGAGGEQGRKDGSTAPGQKQLSTAQQTEVADLQRRDTQVRAHERAHQSAGGSLTGAASFTFQLGPDGKRYAVGGEVPIQFQSGRTPDETIAVAERVKRAALAPADPSAQDLAVAASAASMEQAARAQKARAATQAYAGAAAGRQASAAQAGGRRVVAVAA